MKIEKVFDYNREWVAKQVERDPEYFKKLAAGQHPDILYIGCSDSRVTAEEIIGAHPGEVFVHRNVANLVVNIDLNMLSVLTYAVEHLKVKHIVIAGHYNCNGVKAAMQPKDLGVLNPWLRNIRNVYRLHMEELDALKGNARYDRLVELNVLEQCVNITKTALFQTAHHDYGLQLHGWVFDVRTGKLIDLKFDLDKELKDIKKIYDLMNYKDDE